MSGFEVAGVVLGALPLIFKAVDSSKDGLGRSMLAFKRRKKVEELARAIFLQQQIIAETLKAVIRESGCEEIWRFDQDPRDYLANKSVQEEVADFLGVNNDIALTDVLRQCSTIIETLARNISGLVPFYQGNSIDLLALIQSNKDAPSKQLDVLPRLKLAFGITSIKGSIEELDKITDSFQRFSTVILRNRRSENGDSSRKAIKLAKAFRSVRNHAADVFHAIAGSFGLGCTHPHEASVILEDRIEAATKLLKRSASESGKPSLAFQVLISSSMLATDNLWHECAVQVYEARDEQHMRPPLPAQKSSSSQVSFANSPSAKIVDRPQITSINTICEVLMESTTKDGGKVFAVEGQKLLGVLSSIDQKLCQPTTTSVSLDALFARRSDLPLRLRMRLALLLAASLLQLLQTDWSRRNWSRKTIHFTTNAKDQTVDLSRAFILHAPSEGSSTDMETPSAPKEVLLELGIILLEIWYQTTLEEQFKLAQSPATYMERMGYAFAWLDDTSNPAINFYQDAVEFCCRPDSESRQKDWEDITLWGTICAQVIEPLSKNCMLWK